MIDIIPLCSETAQGYVCYIMIEAMYSTFRTYPVEIRLILSNFWVRPGQTFFQILEAGEVVSVMESDISRLRYSFGVTPVCFLN